MYQEMDERATHAELEAAKLRAQATRSKTKFDELRAAVAYIREAGAKRMRLPADAKSSAADSASRMQLPASWLPLAAKVKVRLPAQKTWHGAFGSALTPSRPSSGRRSTKTRTCTTAEACPPRLIRKTSPSLKGDGSHL